MRNLLLVLLVSLSLSGCALWERKSDNVISIEPVKVDPRALESCKQLPKWAPSGQDKDIQKLEHDRVVLESYAECATRQQNSVQLIKKLANIKE